MNISLIVCTYKRPKSILTLLKSVFEQSVLPFEILIIDGSPDNDTDLVLAEYKSVSSLKYFQVGAETRGLIKQRNFGISKIDPVSDVVAFLDDDLILKNDYFAELALTFQLNPGAIGVGGIDMLENRFFRKVENERYSQFSYYELDGWVVKDSIRFKVRKLFGLLTDLQPDIIPSYSHGRSGFPPNGRTYCVEHLIGMSMAFRKSLFEEITFSSYFEGYGLYEDFDFSVRALKYGDLYVNTNAHVWHYHDPNGRPNTYRYGKMVIRNGWYVWKQRFPKNSSSAIFKWHATAFLLALIRLLNSFTGPNRLDAFKEFIGRLAGWFSLWFNKPTLQ